MSVDWLCPWEGDFSQTPSGNIVRVTDTLDNPAATIQRLYALIQTIPQINDANGIAIAPADDIFNRFWGANLPGMVGELITAELPGALRAQILASLAADDDIDQTSIVVSATVIGTQILFVNIECDTILGAHAAFSVPVGG